MFHPAYCLRGSGLVETGQDVRLLAKLAVGIAAGEGLMA
jgi:hypothetical protein